MNSNQHVVHDERTETVENASYKWPICFLMYALLLDVMYRGWFRNEAAWDLMAMVIVSGALSAYYQYRHNTLAERNYMFVITFFVIGTIGALVAFLLAWHG